MNPWPVDAEVEEVHLPRPGHADLAGVQKFGLTDVRNVLERASARARPPARWRRGRLARAVPARPRRRGLQPRASIGTVSARRSPQTLPGRRFAGVDDVPGPLPRRRRLRGDGRGDQPPAQGQRVAGRDLRGARLRPGARPRLRTSPGRSASDAGSPAMARSRPSRGVRLGEGFELAAEAWLGGPRRDLPLARARLLPRDQPRRRPRGRHDQRRAAGRARGDEAAADADQAAALRRHRHQGARGGSARAHRTRARCPPPAWSARRWWRSSSPTPTGGSSAAITSMTGQRRLATPTGSGSSERESGDAWRPGSGARSSSSASWARETRTAARPARPPETEALDADDDPRASEPGVPIEALADREGEPAFRAREEEARADLLDRRRPANGARDRPRRRRRRGPRPSRRPSPPITVSILASTVPTRGHRRPEVRRARPAPGPRPRALRRAARRAPRADLRPSSRRRARLEARRGAGRRACLVSMRDFSPAALGRYRAGPRRGRSTRRSSAPAFLGSGVWRVEGRRVCVSDDTVAPGSMGGPRWRARRPGSRPAKVPRPPRTPRSCWAELARAPGCAATTTSSPSAVGVVATWRLLAATYQRGVPWSRCRRRWWARSTPPTVERPGSTWPRRRTTLAPTTSPRAVLADPDTLATRPRRSTPWGSAEVVKTALIAGGELWGAASAAGADPTGRRDRSLRSTPSSRSSLRTSATPAASGAQPRPHGRSRDRGDHRIRPLSPRRGRRAGAAGRAPALGPGRLVASEVADLLGRRRACPPGGLHGRPEGGPRRRRPRQEAPPAASASSSPTQASPARRSMSPRSSMG